MTFVAIGAFLIFVGVVFMAGQPLWRGRLSGVRPAGSPGPSDTLEPRRPARGLGIGSNWPGLALVAVGAVLLLFGAAV